MSLKRPRRCWINQPSTNQQFHQYHGSKVIAIEVDENTTEIFFVYGDVISMQIPNDIPILSEGWNPPPKASTRELLGDPLVE